MGAGAIHLYGAELRNPSRNDGYARMEDPRSGWGRIRNRPVCQELWFSWNDLCRGVSDCTWAGEGWPTKVR